MQPAFISYPIVMTRSLYSIFIAALAVMMLYLPLSANVQSPAELSSIDSQMKETSIGDLVADAVKAGSDTPIALIPAGALREVTIPKGTVTADDVLKSLQYPDDKIAVIEITGDQLTKALERSVSIHPQKNLGFLQVSGITLIFNPESPKGTRIKSVKVGDEKIDSGRKYRVATTEPLASGAYGYFTIWGKEVKPKLSDKTTGAALKDFISKNKSVDYRKLERITAEKK